MTGRFRALALVGSLCACSSLIALFAARNEPKYWVLNVDRIGGEQLAKAKSIEGIQWWIEAGDRLLVYGTPDQDQIARYSAYELGVAVKPENLFVVKRAHHDDLDISEADVLVEAGRSAIIQMRERGVPQLKAHKHEFVTERSAYAHAVVKVFEPNLVLSHQAANDMRAEKSKRARFSEAANTMVAGVDGKRWFGDVNFLQTMNRYTHGTEVLKARDWFRDQFSALPHMEVSFFEFKVGQTTAFNVVAKMTGTTCPDDVYIVGGHYDSTSQSPRTAAPGAEDNGSGSAGVLEMARLFAEHPPEATILFMVYSGEEQGLHGSEAHAAALQRDNQIASIKGVINMDMIGYTKSEERLAVTLETEQFAKDFMEVLKASAAQYTQIGVNVSFDAWGSDHVPYLNKHIPAVLTIDNDWSDYPSYHKTTDKIENVSEAMGTEILKMNVGALAQLAGASL